MTKPDPRYKLSGNKARQLMDFVRHERAAGRTVLVLSADDLRSGRCRKSAASFDLVVFKERADHWELPIK